jgi:hypothetical protein
MEYMTPASRDIKKDAATPESSLAEPLDGLSIELSRISAEIQSINSGFQAQMLQVLSDVRLSIENEYRERFKKSVAELREQTYVHARAEVERELQDEFNKRLTHLVNIQREQIQTQLRRELEKEFEAELNKRLSHVTHVQNEIERISTQLEGVAKEIMAMLDDPSVELSKVMRRRTEQAELKAYLEGLRFSVAPKAKAQDAGAS